MPKPSKKAITAQTTFLTQEMCLAKTKTEGLQMLQAQWRPYGAYSSDGLWYHLPGYITDKNNFFAERKLLIKAGKIEKDPPKQPLFNYEGVTFPTTTTKKTKKTPPPPPVFEEADEVSEEEISDNLMEVVLQSGRSVYPILVHPDDLDGIVNLLITKGIQIRRNN